MIFHFSKLSITLYLRYRMLVIIILAGFYAKNEYAQDTDSLALLHARMTQMHGQKRVKTALELAGAYMGKRNLDSALQVLRYVLPEAQRLQDAKLLTKLYFKLGKVYNYSNHYVDAERAYHRAQEYALQTGDTTVYIDLLEERGYIFDYWQKNDSTLALMNQAVELSTKTGYLKGLARASLIIGNIYYGTNRYHKALEYYRRTLDAAQKIPNQYGIAAAYQNIGMCQMYLNEYDSAIRNLQKSSAIHSQLPRGKVPLANGYADLAIVYSRLGDVEKTKMYLRKAMALFKKYGRDENKAIGYNVSAECLSNLGRYRESNRYLDSAIAIARQTDFGLMLQKSYKSYAENLRKTHLGDIAYDTLRQYIQIKDSLQSEKFHRQLAELDSKYRNLEKQRRIEQLQHRQYVDRMQFRILLSSIVVFFLLVVLAVYVYIQKRKQKEQQMKLEKEKAQLQAENLRKELSLKNKQLTMHALSMMQKNQLLRDILTKISHIQAKENSDTQNLLINLKRQIKHLLSSEKDWKTFKIYFEQVNKDFLKRLNKIQPDLTRGDIRLATLMRLNMSNKEIASILNITHQSARNAQNRLRNKLGVASGQKLRDFLNNL